MTARILVIEDGFEYTRALERIAEGRAELVRAGDVAEATRAMEDGSFDAVLLDVVFDRIEPQRLAGAESGRSTEQLTRQQGFYIADALAERLARTRVLVAYDFSGDPERLEALRERLPGLDGIREGTGLDDVLARLLAP